MRTNLFVNIILLIFFICVGQSVFAQITINTNFDVRSNQPIDTRDTLTTLSDTLNTNWLFPGLMSYVLDRGEYWFYNGNRWSPLDTYRTFYKRVNAGEDYSLPLDTILWYDRIFIFASASLSVPDTSVITLPNINGIYNKDVHIRTATSSITNGSLVIIKNQRMRRHNCGFAISTVPADTIRGFKLTTYVTLDNAYERYCDDASSIVAVSQDTTSFKVYAPDHQLTDSINSRLYVPVKRDYTLANSSHPDSVHFAYAIGAPHPDTLILKLSGEHDLGIAHGLTLNEQYYLNDDGTESLTPGTVGAFTVIPITATQVVFTEVGIQREFYLPRRILPSPIITAYGGDPLNPSDSIVQEIVENVYVPLGQAQPGTIFISGIFGSQTQNPNYVNNAPLNAPINPGRSWMWDGKNATRIKEVPIAVNMQASSYGLISLDTVQLVSGVPTDTTVAQWLEDNTANGLRLANGSLIYWGNDYVWSVIDDVTNVSETNPYARITRNIKSPPDLSSFLQYQDTSFLVTSSTLNDSITILKSLFPKVYENALTLDNDTLRWGGLLTQSTIITQGTRTITFNAANSLAAGIAINNTTAGAGLAVVSSLGTAIVATGNAGGLNATGGNSTKAIIATTNSTVANANPDAVVPALAVRRNTSDTPVDGFGVSIEMAAKTNTTNNVNSAILSTKWTDVTHATRTSNFEIETSNNGTLERKMEISGAGQLTLDGYTTNNFIGTGWGRLVVQADGLVVADTTAAFTSNDIDSSQWATLSALIDTADNIRSDFSDSLAVVATRLDTLLEGGGGIDTLPIWTAQRRLGNSSLSQQANRLTLGGNRVLRLEGLTTAQLPSAQAGDLYYNTSLGRLNWVDAGSTRRGIAWQESTADFAAGQIPFSGAAGGLIGSNNIRFDEFVGPNPWPQIILGTISFQNSATGRLRISGTGNLELHSGMNTVNSQQSAGGLINFNPSNASIMIQSRDINTRQYSIHYNSSGNRRRTDGPMINHFFESNMRGQTDENPWVSTHFNIGFLFQSNIGAIVDTLTGNSTAFRLNSRMVSSQQPLRILLDVGTGVNHASVFRIMQSGHVSIGQNANPARLLDVRGGLRILPDSLQFDPTILAGVNSQGDLSRVVLGEGLTLSNDTLYNTGGEGDVLYSDSLVVFVTPTQLSDSLSSAPNIYTANGFIPENRTIHVKENTNLLFRDSSFENYFQIGPSPNFPTIEFFTTKGVDYAYSSVTGDKAEMNVSGTAVTVTPNLITMTGNHGLRIPNGTTAQRPVGSSGITRYNTTNNALEYYGASAWETPLKSSTATGALTANKVIYSDANGRAATNNNFHWNNSSVRLGINNSSPQERLHVQSGGVLANIGGFGSYGVHNYWTSGVTGITTIGNGLLHWNAMHYAFGNNDEGGWVNIYKSRTTNGNVTATSGVQNGDQIGVYGFMADGGVSGESTRSVGWLSAQVDGEYILQSLYDIEYIPGRLQIAWAKNYDNPDIYNKMHFRSNGRIGLNINDPQASLHLPGTLRVGLDSTLHTPNRLSGLSSDGDLSSVFLGEGLTLSNDTLNAWTPKYISKWHPNYVTSVSTTEKKIVFDNELFEGTFTKTDSTITLPAGRWKISYDANVILDPDSGDDLTISILLKQGASSVERAQSIVTRNAGTANSVFSPSSTTILELASSTEMSLSMITQSGTGTAIFYRLNFNIEKL
jgi:hypothetical protein